MAIFVAAAALWTHRQLLVEITYFWGLAGTLQALLTPDLAEHFPSYPYLQYYIAHGGVVAAALVLVAGMRLHPRPWAVAQVALVTVAYTGFVGLVDAVTGSDYMYLRSKPSSPTLLDELGPWPLGKPHRHRAPGDPRRAVPDRARGPLKTGACRSAPLRPPGPGACASSCR